MKNYLELLLADVNALIAWGHVRSEGEMRIKSVKSELERLIAEPEPEPKIVEVEKIVEKQVLVPSMIDIDALNVLLNTFKTEINSDMQVMKDGYSELLVHVMDISEAVKAKEVPAVE